MSFCVVQLLPKNKNCCYSKLLAAAHTNIAYIHRSENEAFNEWVSKFFGCFNLTYCNRCVVGEEGLCVIVCGHTRFSHGRRVVVDECDEMIVTTSTEKPGKFVCSSSVELEVKIVRAFQSQCWWKKDERSTLDFVVLMKDCRRTNEMNRNEADKFSHSETFFSRLDSDEKVEIDVFIALENLKCQPINV